MSDKNYSLNAASYDKIAEKWHSFRKSSPLNVCIEEFATMIKKGGKVLDVGCGTGYPISFYLANQGFEVVGTDPSEKMLEKAVSANIIGAKFIKSDFLNFECSCLFDAIIAFDCLWHIAPEFQKNIYAKAASLLKRGGMFMFTHGAETGEREGEMFGEPFYYSALDLKTTLRLLENNGFTVLRAEKDYKEKTTGERDLLVFAKKLCD